jgi:LysR family transcriptional regulator of gallate degradation
LNHEAGAPDQNAVTGHKFSEKYSTLNGTDSMEPISLPSLRYLRVFETVARLESVSRASTAIHLSQPAVTQAIAKLEGEVCATLFERRHTGTYLTEAGVIFRRRTQRLFAQIEEALREFGVDSGNLRKADLATEAGKITRTQIRSFAAIARSGSLAQAARVIGISQSSLHRAVRDLEGQLGRPLYRHTAHGIIATKAGVELARRMMLATREIECAIEELKAADGAVGGRIAIGAQLMGSSFLIGSLANKVIQKYPQARFQIFNDSYDSLLNALRTGSIDYIVGTLRSPAPMPDVIEEALFRDPYIVVARQGHPLTRSRNVTLEELARYPWVVPLKGSMRRQAFEQVFASLANPPRIGIETYSLTVIRTILAESDHVSLLTRYETACEQRVGQLVPVHFAPAYAPASLGITTRVGWLPTQLQLGFLALLRNHALSLSESQAPRVPVYKKAVALAG